MDTSIYRYIIRFSLKRQLVLTLMAIASFPFLYAFLELPKIIVNDAIQAEQSDLSIALWSLGTIELAQLDYLFVLTGFLLVLIAINQSFKYALNVYSGITGERMLRRLRYDLYGRILRFPLSRFRRTSQGEVITMVATEVEPLGGFVGDAFKLPVYQGGYLLVTLSFLFIQNWTMALAAVALYPLQLYLIPRLQRRVNLLAKERVALVRRLSDRIGESVAGVQEVHVHNTARRELAGFSQQLDGIYNVRLQIYIWKFVIKFLNNSINQLGPFCYYTIGGWLTIKGELDIGTLLAAIAAHKELAAPWKELLNFYQRQQDARIKFEQVVMQFEPEGMMDPSLQLDEPEEIAPIRGEVVAANVGLVDDTDASLVENVSLTLDCASSVALVGAGGSGKEELSQLLARLVNPHVGTLEIGGRRADTLPEAVTGRRLSYVGSVAFMFSSTVGDNLLYGVRHVPLQAARYDPSEAARRARALAEAAATGNSGDDPDADWIDYDAVGAADEAALLDRIFEVLCLVGLDRDIYELGLRGTIDPEAKSGLAERFLEARAALAAELQSPEFAGLVEIFDAERYNDNATLAENLLFGTPVGKTFDINNLAENPHILALLESRGLTGILLDAGRRVAATMVEIFADLPRDHPFFERFSFISSDDLPEFRILLARIARDGIDTLDADERTMFLSLPFKLCPARHRLGIIDDDLRTRILEARRAFAAGLTGAYRGAVEFFDVNRFNAAASLQDNILFGKVAHGQAGAAERVGEIMAEVIRSLGLENAVRSVGLDFHVGSGGGRLTGTQRQKLAIARSVLKRPDILILNEAAAGLDGAAQSMILNNLKREFQDRGLIWAVHRASMAREFDQVVVMRSGRVVEQGSFEELDREGTALRQLIEAE